MNFLPLLLLLFLCTVLASQKVEDSHDVVAHDSTISPADTTPSTQQLSPPKSQKLLPWPLDLLLPRSLRRISFRKLTVYLLKQPLRFIRYAYRKIISKGKENEDDDSKVVVVVQDQHQ